MATPQVMSTRSIIGLVAALFLVILAPLAPDAIGGDFGRGTSSTPVRLPRPAVAVTIWLT